MKRLLGLATVLLALSALLAHDAPAQASFPGKNGDILFDSNRDGDSAIWRMKPDGTGQVKLADSPGLDFGGEWSPDGSKIAFTSERDGNREIYVMNADGSDQKRLTNNVHQDFEPSWHPDGEIIIFRSSLPNGDLWTVGLDGGAPVPLADLPGDVSEPHFSPDGTKIVFKYDLGDFFTLHVINADGTGLRKLTTANTSEDDPKWSPDGEKIIFIRSIETAPNPAGLGGPVGIFVINADGTNEVNLTHEPAGDSDPDFSPDGTTIIFYSDRGSGEGIHLMDLDATNIRLILENAYSPHWQPIPDEAVLWGDADCSGAVDPIDALKTLRKDSGLNVVSEPGCPDIGAEVEVLGVTRVWGDIDCSGAADPIDALKLLRHDSGLPVTKAEGCPQIDDYFVVVVA